MKTYKPIMEEEKIIKFNKQELRELLERLEESGADEIGVSIKESR